MHSSVNQFLVTRQQDPALALRREILVTGLFKYVAEIQEIEDGYLFKFRRSELVVRRVSDYLLFEGQHSPQLTFAVVVEPNGSAMWLEIRGLEQEMEQIRTAYQTHPLLVSPLT